MTDDNVPADAPPSYEDATGSSSSTHRPSANTSTSASRKVRNGIPPDRRRSMEDEARELPAGWVRQFDPKSHHQFFVDTRCNPPRAIWHHPYDDDEFLSTLPSEERERIQTLQRTPTLHDIAAESSDEDDHHHHGSGAPTELPPRPVKGGFGRKLKDKITGTTHEEREQQRQQRAEEERRIYAQHQAYRQALARAMETGQPQKLGQGRDGKDVWILPPDQQGYNSGYQYGGGYGYGSGYGYNPYQQGPYVSQGPGGTYIRPANPYSRPYGSGYGGGMGMPLMLGAGTGLLGGMLLGDALGGGFF